VSDIPPGEVPGSPGLRRLLALLTGPAGPRELAGERAALEMFRQARQGHSGDVPVTLPAVPPARSARGLRLGPAAPPPAPRRARHGARPVPVAPPPGPRRPRRRAWPGPGPIRLRWVALAIASGLAAAFAAAGFAAVLPAPLQHIAYRVLGFAGVPDARPGSGRAVSPRSPGAGGPWPSPASPAGSVRPGTPRTPAAARSPALTAVTAPARIPAGGNVVITALLAARGRGLAGRQLRLLELAAGQREWRLAATARTGAGGRAMLVLARLTVNASFQVAGPGRARSQVLRVTVVPGIALRLADRRGRRSGVLQADCAFARPGDLVELQERLADGWRVVRVRHLGHGGTAAFAVSARGSPVGYRVVLLATPVHGEAVSATIIVAPRRHAGRYLRQGSPGRVR